MSRFKYDFNILTNRKTFRYLEEDSPLRILLETVKEELTGESNLCLSEDIGDGDGMETDFSGTLANPGIRPGSLSIYAVIDSEENRERFTDRGDGTLISSKGGTGTIDYSSGAFAVSFNTPPYSSEDVYADYVGNFTTFGFTADALNPAYDARFIPYASGLDLDLWGETLGLPRKAGDPDAPYRTRLLNELRDVTASLTVDALKDRVEQIMGSGKRPEIIENWTLVPDWPLEWWKTTEPWSTWVPWEELVDFLVVLDPVLVDDEDIGVGDGGTTHFEGYLAEHPLKAGSLAITDGVETFTDQGDGTLDGNLGGDGTIDYQSGAWVVNFNTAPGLGIHIYADYSAYPTSLLNQLCTGIEEVKYAPTHVLLVYDTEQGYYRKLTEVE